MKKRILLVTLLVALFICVFAISVSAETMARYITFDVLLEGETEYQTVYTPEGRNDAWTVYVSFGNEFYTDVDQSATIDKTKIVKIDMSNAKGYGFNNNNVKQLLAASDNSVFAKVTEIKFPNNPGNFNMVGGSFCKGWSSLTTIDFGSAYQTGDNSFENCTAIKELTIPEQMTKINNNSFKGCTNLTTVYFNGNNENGNSIFSNCTSLTTVVLGSNFKRICSGMFNGCSSLTEITIPEGVTEIGSSAFMGTQLVSLHVPSTVTSIGMQVAENLTTFTTLTFAPNSQLKTIDHRAFQNSSLSGDLVLPYGLVDIDYNAFANTDITSVKIPMTVTNPNLNNGNDEYYGVFSGCTSLVYAELSGANIGSDFFSGCTALKAVVIGEGVEKINNKAFYNCSELRAVYLPSTLKTIGSSANWGQGAFDGCKKLYFVNEPFAVRDENGVLLGDSFVMPTEPEVYFMPASLETVYGCEFKDCQQINRYVVFPTGVTQITAWEGAFSNTGINNTKGAVTYVFLGDMTTFCYSARDNRYKNVSYVFANANDTSISSLTKFQLGYKAAAVNSYMYFCAGNVAYDLSSFTAGSESYIVQETDFTKTEYTDENQPHFSNPRKAVVTPADCLNARKEVQECFCGAPMGEKTIGTALGHNHDLTKGASITDIVYENGYMSAGAKEIKCSRCDVKDYNTAVDALFNGLVYSVAEQGFGICVKYNINKDAVAICKDAGKTVSFGVVAIMADKVEGNGPLANDGTVSTQRNVIAADVTADNLCSVTLRISGDENTWKSNADKAIYVLGYATDGEDLEYLGTASETAAERNNIASVKSLVIGKFFNFNA